MTSSKRKVPVPQPSQPPTDLFWSFTSTDREFDGARILREAAEAGFELVQVTRNNTITLATGKFVGRLERLFNPYHWIRAPFQGSWTLSTTPGGRLIRNLHADPVGPFNWARRSDAPPIETLLQQLAQPKRPTTVKGWRIP